ETGLYYYRARYYDANVGRFTQRDPIGFKGGINLYAALKNNPINFKDPKGLANMGPYATNPYFFYYQTKPKPGDKCYKCSVSKIVACIWDSLGDDPDTASAGAKCVISIWTFVKTGVVADFDVEACSSFVSNMICSDCFKNNCPEGKIDACGNCN
ncbi:MAG TPA: RHS repeat-associated core domain-containing protein, partial [Clostridia bacterium]